MERARIEKISKALADATRLMIFEAISAKKEMVCGELVALRGVTPATVSHHLKISFRRRPHRMPPEWPIRPQPRRSQNHRRVLASPRAHGRRKKSRAPVMSKSAAPLAKNSLMICPGIAALRIQQRLRGHWRQCVFWCET
jgi:hypothetical protein